MAVWRLLYSIIPHWGTSPTPKSPEISYPGVGNRTTMWSPSKVQCIGLANSVTIVTLKSEVYRSFLLLLKSLIVDYISLCDCNNDIVWTYGLPVTNYKHGCVWIWFFCWPWTSASLIPSTNSPFFTWRVPVINQFLIYIDTSQETRDSSLLGIFM